MSRRRLIYLGLGFAAVFVATATLLGPYRQTAAATGSPLSTNLAPDPAPPLFDTHRRSDCLYPPWCFRPGTTSIASTYLTFRLASLLTDPYTTQGLFRYSRQRTSLWSRLYGSANSIHFDQWPPSWADRREWVLDLTRVALLLGLLPAILLVIGLLRAAALVARRLRHPRARSDLSWSAVLLAASTLGFIASLVLYTWRHRDFTCMKVIYLLPAIIPFAFVFANECERFFDWLRRHYTLRVGTWISLGALLLVYVTDTLVLVGHLA